MKPLSLLLFWLLACAVFICFNPGVIFAYVTIDGIPYPDPLRNADGSTVSRSDWTAKRRTEVLAFFKEYAYGHPLPAPSSQTFGVVTTDFPNAIRKQVTINVTGPHGTTSFLLKIFLPKTLLAKKPVFLKLENRATLGASDPASDDPTFSDPLWPVAPTLARGFGIAAIRNTELALDDAIHYRKGVIDCFFDSSAPLPNNAGRAISAWAWGAMRAMDYFETDPDIDATRIVRNRSFTWRKDSALGCGFGYAD
jgi:hypothetical protein